MNRLVVRPLEPTTRKQFPGSLTKAGPGVGVLGAALGLPHPSLAAGEPPATPPPKPDLAAEKGLTHAVAKFVAGTDYSKLPAEVIELGKISILEGMGRALAGSRAKSGAIVEKYLSTLGSGSRAKLTEVPLRPRPLRSWREGRHRRGRR